MRPDLTVGAHSLLSKKQSLFRQFHPEKLTEFWQT